VDPHPPLPVPLTALDAGATARLHDTRLDDDTRALLRSLGLTDASRLRVCKRGEPFIIQVRATRIGVSRSVAGGIFVIPESPAHAGHHARQ
jgi:Fe2+ transport system protein FeoA